MAKLNISIETPILSLTAAFILLVTAALVAFRSTVTVQETSIANHSIFKSGLFGEGKITPAILIAGPFDVHRRYRSMEGPYIQGKFKVGDLVASKQAILPENRVSYIERSSGAVAMMGADGGSKSIQGLVDTSSEARNLLWLKGAKLEVLDENDKILPTAEFICHWNLDVNRAFRSQVFPQGEWCMHSRLMTISQGQNEIYFPEGYAVPVASDEVWNVMFQVANRTTDDHRRIKHRCTLYFIKDSDLVYPITALNWYAHPIYVVTDKNSSEASLQDKSNCPSCSGVMPGVNAPNNVTKGIFKDDRGRVTSGHWVIPPGIHTYATPLGESMEPGFSAKSRTIHAVWSHVHPFCTSLTLYKCNADSRQQVFSNSVKTKTKPGIEIESINYLCSKEGIAIDQGARYELEVAYNNTSGEPQDSMAVAGIFCADNTFARPDWALNNKVGNSCGIEPPSKK